MPPMAYVLKPAFKQTPAARRFVRKFFEWENCGECKRGARGHVAVDAALGPFALCNPKKGDTLSIMQKKAFTLR